MDRRVRQALGAERGDVLLADPARLERQPLGEFAERADARLEVGAAEVVLRVLTVFSAILLPLTLIASVFGMNVAFPGHATAHAFWVIIALMVVAIVGLVGFFRWKRWI